MYRGVGGIITGTTISSGLAYTGAPVFGAVFLGLALLATGLLTLRAAHLRGVSPERPTNR